MLGIVNRSISLSSQGLRQVPTWCQADAQKAYEELSKINAACKKTIEDSGVTELTFTIADAEAQDSKGKAAAKVLANMLVAAKQRKAA